ncbi:MAG: PQQ-binding-like beta-propeller repeat protein [Bryobacteraceae bacterium]
MRLLFAVAFAMAVSAAPPDGAAVFESHCATCHQTETGSRTPTRAELGNLTPEQVMNALLRGKMTMQGATLATSEVRSVALYVTGKNLSSAAVDPAAGRCTSNPKFSPGSGDWNGWGVNLSNARYQPNPGFKAEDASRLKLKWAFGFPDDTQAAAQPTIVSGRLFVGSNGGTVYSLDASTGCVYWTYDAVGIVRTAISIVRSPKSSRWIAYFGDYHAWAHAVDAETGKPLWKVKVDDHPAARIVGSPTYYKGRLYVPVASSEELVGGSPQYECCTFRGSLLALDAETGQKIWKSYSVPDPPKAYKKNSAGTQLYGPAGAGVWNSPTIDEKRQRVYVNTGNSFTGIDLPTSDSILAFDLASGSLLWSVQATPRDNWMVGCPKGPNCPDDPGDDLDFGSSSVLRSLPSGKQVLVATQKAGLVYGFDPDQRGKILWQTRVGAGGAQGGILWGGAFDDHAIYTAVSDLNKGEKGMPGMYAVRFDTGEKLWSTPAPEGAGVKAALAAVSAMPGIAFSGSWGGRLRAYSTKTGEIVWDFDALRDFDTINHVPAHGGSFDGGGPAIANGMLITTSGYGFVGGKAGNVLLAFSVDGK